VFVHLSHRRNPNTFLMNKSAGQIRSYPEPQSSCDLNELWFEWTEQRFNNLFVDRASTLFCLHLNEQHLDYLLFAFLLTALNSLRRNDVLFAFWMSSTWIIWPLILRLNHAPLALWMNSTRISFSCVLGLNRVPFAFWMDSTRGTRGCVFQNGIKSPTQSYEQIVQLDRPLEIGRW